MQAQGSKPVKKPTPGIRGDERFSFMTKDPRFRHMPKQQQKFKVDNRFAGMFKDKRFKMDYVIDKTGRKIATGEGSNDLTRMYEVEEPEEEDEGDELLQEGDEGDLAEAEGDSTTSDSGDSDVDADLQAWTEEEQRKAEEEADIPEGDATSRLAIVNLDWDSIKAVDILMLLNSFLPPGCHINNVTVYPSDYGLAQMAAEAARGPVQLWETATGRSKEKGPAVGSVLEDKVLPSKGKAPAKGSSLDEADQEKLRAYEEQRLKYYYAIVECDSVNAARALYAECDGLEFEATSNVLDLRFVPEGTTFENQPRDNASQAPANYQPPNCLRRGLHHTKLECSWDQDDPVRANKIKQKRKALTKDAEMEEDLAVYMASDSSDEGYGTDAVTEAEDEDSTVVLKRKPRSKFKALLHEFKDHPEEKEDVEIVFKPGLSDKATEFLENMEKRKTTEQEGPWEEKLRKRAEALKAKKKRRKERLEEQAAQDEDEGEDRGLTKEEKLDPFFASLDDEAGFEPFPEDAEKPRVQKEKKAKKSKKGNQTPKAEDTKKEAEDERKNAELDLLMMGEQDERRGFSLTNLLKPKDSKTQRKKQKNKVQEPAVPVNVRDPRFDAMYTNPDCAIDPTHPSYTPTVAMDQFLEERQRRTRESQERQALQAARGKQRAKDITDSDSLSSLVASVKQKTKLNKIGLIKPAKSVDQAAAQAAQAVLPSKPRKKKKSTRLNVPDS